MPGDPRNLSTAPKDSAVSEKSSGTETRTVQTAGSFEFAKLDLSKVDLNPDAKDSVSREYAKRLAMKHAYAHSLAHFTPADSKYGNLILPALCTNEMHVAQNNFN